ncbi:hypothetical protein HY478_01880 [Candidatus Uhrbacteria bacterium]|nr:hypothetical protein [Candidatus Uhrbacteria bacterium]
MPDEAGDTTQDMLDEEDEEARAREAAAREGGETRRGRPEGGARADETPEERELRELRERERALKEEAEQPRQVADARQRVANLERERARREAAGAEAAARERTQIVDEEQLAAARAERAEKIHKEREEAEQAFERRDYLFGKEHLLVIAKSPGAKEGDLVRVEILDSEGRTALDLWKLLPPGTRLVASKNFAPYDRAADAVPVPVLDPSFGPHADRDLMGVLHEIVHARNRDELPERNRNIAEAHAHAEYERFRRGPQTLRDKARLETADRRAAELRATSELAAWDGSKRLIMELWQEKKVDVVPGYGEWPEKEGEMKPAMLKKIQELLLGTEAMYLAAPDARGRSRFTEAPVARGLGEVQLGAFRKGWFKRGLVGVLAYFFVAPAIVARELFGWVKQQVTGDKKEGGAKKVGGGGRPTGGGGGGGKRGRNA